jgi:hypothetical protein
MAIVFPKIAIIFLEIHIVTFKSRLWINFSIMSLNSVVEAMWYYWASYFLTLIKVISGFHVLPEFIKD